MSNEERQLCEQYYSQAIAETATDEEELAIALALLEQAEKGFVVNDAGTGLIYISEPNLPVDAEYLVEEETPQQRLRQALPGIAVLIVGAILLLLFSSGGGGTAATPTPAATTKVAVYLPTMTLTPVPTTPTPMPTNTPTRVSTATPTPLPTTTPTPVLPREVEIKPEPVKLEPGTVIPVSLEIAGRYFAIVPTTLRDDTWACLPDQSRISWLAGSYVNVVLGLPYSADNLELVTRTLALSDTLTLRTSVGGTNTYQVLKRKSVGVYEIEVLSQRQAGLTLVLVSGGTEGGPDRRVVVWAVPTEVREE